MIDIPDDYFRNLSCYEEFLIRCTLIGEKPSSEFVLGKLQYADPYFWFIAGNRVCMIDKNGNLVENATVDASFRCTHCRLDSLEGCPSKIRGSFGCSDNKLATLEGSPEEIGFNFYCYMNNLASLEGCRVKKISGTFDCSFNKIVSLKGCPDVIEINFDCSNNKLVSLEGGPSIVKGFLICNNNPLRTLKGAPGQGCRNFGFQYTSLTQKQIDAYREFLRHPTPDLMDDTGHYCPKE